MKKILMLATYTIAKPQHGGQKRVRALYERYKKSGFDVKFCAVYFPPHYPDAWPEDIAIPRQESLKMAQNPLTGDVITGRIVSENAKIRSRIKKLIKTFNPDIIELEHPFLYIGLEEVLSDMRYPGRLIYSSHNIEYSMKEEMLEGIAMPKQDIRAFVDEIEQAERALVKKADLIYSVSEGDSKVLTKLGAKSKSIILARNGIDKEPYDKAEVAYWDSYFKNRGIDRIALFVGSAHPPNWTGFSAMIGAKVGFLKPNERIVMAGSIGEYFRDSFAQDPVDAVVFWKRILVTGRLSEPKLAGLLQRADCLILPIIEGGGSNLKTAEALLSEKPVVGTSHAFRAFEKFESYKTIAKTDDPAEFRRFIASALRNDKPKITVAQQKELHEVTWDQCLDAAIRGAAKL